MIKFFRKIRQNLIMKNKTGKYFKYAIGEIILVVIGILIALQINNWNEQRKEQKRADAFVKKLITQTKYNINETEKSIQRYDNFYQTSKRLVSIIGNEPSPETDAKIDSLVSANFRDYHLNLDLNVIIEARENGDLALLHSDTIRHSLYELTKKNDAIIERERITNEDLNILFVPYLNKNYNFRNNSELEGVGTSKLYKGDNAKILKDQEFENYIISRMEYNKANLQLYKEMKRDLEALNQLLKSI